VLLFLPMQEEFYLTSEILSGADFTSPVTPLSRHWMCADCCKW
jgi:hypothetical protein